MNYDKVGIKIRKIREDELHKTREEFAEEINFSVDTIARMENGKSAVKNIEAYINVAYLSGYSLDELLLDENHTGENEKIIKENNIDIDNYYLYKHNNHSKKNLEYAPTDTYSFVILDNKNPLTYDVEKALEQYEKNCSPTEIKYFHL